MPRPSGWGHQDPRRLGDGAETGSSVRSGPEAPAGTGHGGDGVVAAAGESAAAVSTAGAGATAEVDGHVGQSGAPRASGAAGTGGPADVDMVEGLASRADDAAAGVKAGPATPAAVGGRAEDLGVVLSLDGGKPEAPDANKDRGEDALVETPQANDKPADAMDVTESRREPVEVKTEGEDGVVEPEAGPEPEDECMRTRVDQKSGQGSGHRRQ